MQQLQRYFFTFGQDHVNNQGMPLRDYFVTVMAFDYEQARNLFLVHFADHQLPRRMQWSMQYTEGNFHPSSFPKGEYLSLPMASPGKHLYNTWWHIRSLQDFGRFENQYDLATRSQIIFTIHRLISLGFTSRCQFLLDGSIRILLEHPDEHVTGHYNPGQIFMQKEAPSNGLQPKAHPYTIFR